MKRPMGGHTFDERVRAIALRLTQIADDADTLAAEVAAMGYAAFIPTCRFIESFAASAEDVDVHRRYVVEQAKGYLGQFYPGARTAYSSSLIAELKEAAKSSPLLDDASTAWIPQLQVDPCEQSALVMKVRNPKEYERRKAAMIEQRANQLAIETKRHASGLSSRYPLAMVRMSSRLRFVATIVVEELASIGFTSATAKTEEGYSLAKKDVCSQWALVWAVRDVDMLFRGAKSGMVLLALEARRSLGEHGRAAASRSFPILLQTLLYGFRNSYASFNNLDMLETNVKAHMALFRLVFPKIEDAISSLG